MFNVEIGVVCVSSIRRQSCQLCTSRSHFLVLVLGLKNQGRKSSSITLTHTNADTQINNTHHLLWLWRSHKEHTENTQTQCSRSQLKNYRQMCCNCFHEPILCIFLRIKYFKQSRSESSERDLKYTVVRSSDSMFI